MKFRNFLIVEKTSKPVGIFIGRMSPPTIAHAKIIDDAVRKYGEVYIIIIEGIDTSKLEKNFLSFKDRVDVLKITNPRSKPILARKGYIPDIITDNKIDTSNGIAIIAGSDRIDGYKRQFKDADYKVIFDEIKRTASDVSASKVRKAIADNDFDTYKRMIAPGLDNEKWFKLFQKGMKIKGFEMLESIPVYKNLFEAVNKHMEHFEDSVFDGQDGIKRNIEMVGPIFDTLNGTGKNITMKWDGAPAVIFGTDPVTDKFFVSTKGIFAKTPKVAYSESDIDKLFPGGAGPKLKEAFRYLKSTDPTNIYQGDLLFTSGDKKRETIDGKQYLTFTPNTITYAVPLDSDLANEVARAKIGIVVHTRYKGEIGNLSATFDVKANEFKKSSTVWLQDAFVNDASKLNLEKSELNTITGILKMIDTKKDVVEKIDSKVIELLKMYKNNRIKSDIGILKAETGIRDFIDYIEERYENDINTLKTDNSKILKTKEKEKIIEYIDDNSSNITLVFKIYNWFVKIKMIVLNKLNQIENIGTFVRQGDGYKVTAPEGFVAISNDGSVAKLVDRLEFSRLNFTIPKNW